MNDPMIKQSTLNEDARLIILKELAVQKDACLHSGMLHMVLQEFGHRGSREWVETQLYKLEDVGGVVVKTAGSVVIAYITRAGLRHVGGHEPLAGVARPSRTID